jgi:hypothetical protein
LGREKIANEEDNMSRIALDLNQTDDLKKVKGQWRVGPGLVPGEPNEGLKAQLLNTPARLSDYDDSRWRSALTSQEPGFISPGIASPSKYRRK